MKTLKYLLIFAGLFVSLFTCAADATRTVRGKITDASLGEEIIAVSIVLKGTNTGTVSDIDGRYSLTIPQGRQTLVFSYIGFKTQEIVVEPNTTVVNVVMQEDDMLLDEVVVTGYGVQSKSMLLGAMSGKVAGVSVVNKTGSKSKGTTWKRSGMPENSIRLEVGDNDFLPLQAAQMAVQVDGFRVRVLLDCFFFNDRQSGLEGVFKLRLPTGATPYYFAFGETEYINEDESDHSLPNKKAKNSGKQIPFIPYSADNFNLSPENIEHADGRDWYRVKAARIVSKQKAARAYEETVSARIDPALMEWAGADFFTCRVFPLAKNKLHRVVIGYDLNMTEALDFREYLMALPQTTGDFRLDADIYSSPTMEAVVTPAAEFRQEGNHRYFSLINPKKKEYAIRYNTVEPVLLSDARNDYFAANYRIQLPEVKQENLPADAVFMLDVSLSSQPDKFNVWLKLMEEILTKNTNIIKQFAVVGFNIETLWWSRSYSKNNYYNVQQFLEYANTLALEGATDLGSALREASHPDWLKNNRPKHIFVMSDADFNWGESNMHAFQSLIASGDRIHTYKTGLSGTNNAALDYLSKTSGGFAFTVTGEEEAALTAQSFRYRPWMIEEIRVEGVEDFMISGQPSQLYNGQKLIFGGRGMPEGEVYIRVNNGKETKELQFSAKENVKSDLARRMYGQLALSQLESYSFQTEEATESYATYFRIPNATMSFLMLESEWDYDRFGIHEDDAEDFVHYNTVEAIVKALSENNETIALGNGKADFIHWLKKQDHIIEMDSTLALVQYLQDLPEEVFTVKLKPYNYRVRLAEQQTDEEKTMLADENVLYDNLLSLANARKSPYGKPAALKLLSSVVERNPGDFVALRDLAIKAIEWDMGDQAYYMMRRIIANRSYEAVAYLTAAEALAKSGNIDLAIVYYSLCIDGNWDSKYGSFKEIAALRCLRFIDEIEKNGLSGKITLYDPVKKYLPAFKKEVEKYLKDAGLYVKEADVVMIINWNTNNTDIDLHVIEPSGEECYYGHRTTEIGGQLTIDVTQGYGPEMYVLKNAVNGKYRATLDYYSDDNTKTASKSKVYVDFYRNWGRADEKHTRKTIVLDRRKDMEDIIRFEVKKTIK